MFFLRTADIPKYFKEWAVYPARTALAAECMIMLK